MRLITGIENPVLQAISTDTGIPNHDQIVINHLIRPDCHWTQRNQYSDGRNA